MFWKGELVVSRIGKRECRLDYLFGEDSKGANASGQRLILIFIRQKLLRVRVADTTRDTIYRPIQQIEDTKLATRELFK